MSTSTTTYHPVRSPYASDGHVDEFADVIDSLGRLWNPLKHPRDRFGRFIRVFSSLKFNMPDSRGPGTEVSGRAVGIDRDGSLLVKVTGKGKNAPEDVQIGQYVKVPHDKVEVQTIKAQLNGAKQKNAATGKLMGQEATSVGNAVELLRKNGMDEQADKLQEALDLSMQDIDPNNTAGSQVDKDRAIDLYREVAEAVDDEKGKNFEQGDDFKEKVASLPAPERARLAELDTVVKTAITARLSVGGKVINDVQNDQGSISGKAPEVRIGAAENELEKDFNDGVPVWDITSGTAVQTALQQPQKATINDTVRQQEGQKILPALRDAIYQQVTSGRNRLAGYKQGRRVAPADRWHVDSNGEVVGVGSIVHVDASTSGKASREEFTGTLHRINIDPKGNKTLVIRQYDPEFRLGNKNRKGVALPYKDHTGVTSKSFSLASAEDRMDLNKQLALLGDSAVARSLTEALSDDFIDKMQRRFAGPGAKRTAPTGGSATTLPTQDRVKVDINGEMVKVDDKVMGPNGEVGTVLWISGAGDNTVRVEWPNGQITPRITSRALTRLHGTTSATSLHEKAAYADNMYAPTREESAAIFDEMGATSVAEAVRSGGDDVAIKDAMQTDAAFQAALPDAQPLYQRKNETLSAGQELSPEDRAELGKWDRVAAASMGQFREPNAPPPEPPKPPEPETPEQRPQNPANTTEVITPDGVPIRTEGDQIIVDDDTEEPIPQEDTDAVETKVTEAGGKEKPPEDVVDEVQPPQEAQAPTSLGAKVADDVTKLIEEAKSAPNVTGIQRAFLDKHAAALKDAVDAQDADALITSLRNLQTAVNRQVNANLRRTNLSALLNGQRTGGTPMADFLQARLDAGQDIFDGGAPAPVRERPQESTPDVTPEGVTKEVDRLNEEMAEGLLSDDGSTKVMVGNEVVEEGFYVVDPDSIAQFDAQPTVEDITGFLNDTSGSDLEGVSVWFDEADGKYRMARVSVHEDRDSAAQAAQVAGSNQFVDIADGSVHNIATGGDVDAETPESIEDPRSEERSTRTAGAGKVTARTTAKQKKVLDHLGEIGGDEEITRITQAIKNGEEISGADASRLADFIGSKDVSQFDKPSDKGVATQMADRLARAGGESGARGYSSQATALRRTSDTAILLDALSNDDAVRALTQEARDAVKAGDNVTAAGKFREAADAYDALSTGNDMPSRKARQHADRLDAAIETQPAPDAPPTPEQVPGETPPPEQPPAPEGDGAQTARDELDAAGLPEVTALTQSQFSNPDTPRTRQVSPSEYAALALKGKELLNGLIDNDLVPEALSGQTWEEIKSAAWDAAQVEWGGITADAHTGQLVTGETDQYAITFRPPGMDTVFVPIGASQEEFNAAMEEARARFGGKEQDPLWSQNAHIGVFNNVDTGQIEIDPVLVFDNLDDVEAVGAYSGSDGGAFNFKDGLGYWPPYVAEEEAGGAGTGQEGVPGSRGLESPSTQGGEAQPGLPPQGEAPGGEEAPDAVDILSIDPTAPDADQFRALFEWLNDHNQPSAALGEAVAEFDGSPEAYRRIYDGLDQVVHKADSPENLVEEVDRLQALAEANIGVEAPGGGEPGTGPGGAPFLNAEDPSAVREALADPKRRKEFADASNAYFDAQFEGISKLHSQSKGDRIAEAEIHALERDVSRNAANIDDLVAYAEDDERDGDAAATRTMDHFGSISENGDLAEVLNILNGKPTPVPARVEDFMGTRAGRAAERARADIERVVDPSAKPDLKMIRAQMEAGGSDAVARWQRAYAANMDDYVQINSEMAAILQAVKAVQDPQTRLSMNPAQFKQLAGLVNRLDTAGLHAQRFLADLQNHGVDTTALEAPLREMLDGYGATSLLDANGGVPDDIVMKFLNAGDAYVAQKATGKPAVAEATEVINRLADRMEASGRPDLHHQFASTMRMMVKDAIAANNGSIPPEMAQALRNPIFAKYGAFTDVLARLDIDDALKDPDVDIRAATNGRYAEVEWENNPEFSPDLVVDDRDGSNPSGSNKGADKYFDEAIATLSPNVASALNSMFTSMGGGIHRTEDNIAQASTRDSVMWRENGGWSRGGTGSADERQPQDVEGVFVKDANTVIVADQRVISDANKSTSVVVHELGHALDSMLGETIVEGAWFTHHDAAFKKMHERLKKAASYGPNSENSILRWYYRNADEFDNAKNPTKIKHNGNSGGLEIFAQGYAAYAAGRAQAASLPEEMQQDVLEDVYFAVGESVSAGTSFDAKIYGLSYAQISDHHREMGRILYEYFDDLETNRLPKIMSERKVMSVEGEFRAKLLSDALAAPPSPPVQQRPTPSQVSLVSTHNSKTHGVIQMEHLTPGTPEWDAKMAEIKAQSPGAALPPPAALYVTFNPDFKEQGASLIWKAVMPGKKDPSYEYTDEHKATQLAAKFQRQKKVHQVIGKVRTAAEAEAPYDETAAAVLALIETGARVASDEKAGTTDRKTGKKVTTFGTSTMLKKHVFFPSPTLMRFKYQGKANKANVYETRNPVLIAVVKQLLEGKGPSDQVFANTNSNRAIQYLREKSGMPDIINHDTRTDYATTMAHELVAKTPKSKMPKDEAALKRLKNEISKKVGLAINDTPSVARDSYISPAVWIPLEHSAGVAHEFEDSPPYGLVEGEVVQSIGGPAVPGQPPVQAPPGGAPPAPVAAAAAAEEPKPEPEVEAESTSTESAEPETYQMDRGELADKQVDEWFEGFLWPDPPIIAGPDPEALAEEQAQVQPQEQESA